VTLPFNVMLLAKLFTPRPNKTVLPAAAVSVPVLMAVL
jgi:hypothetical protein